MKTKKSKKITFQLYIYCAILQKKQKSMVNLYKTYCIDLKAHNYLKI